MELIPNIIFVSLESPLKTRCAYLKMSKFGTFLIKLERVTYINVSLLSSAGSEKNLTSSCTQEKVMKRHCQSYTGHCTGIW